MIILYHYFHYFFSKLLIPKKLSFKIRENSYTFPTDFTISTNFKLKFFILVACRVYSTVMHNSGTQLAAINISLFILNMTAYICHGMIQ